MAEGNIYASKTELLEWVNGLLQLQLSRYAKPLVAQHMTHILCSGSVLNGASGQATGHTAQSWAIKRDLLRMHLQARTVCIWGRVLSTAGCVLQRCHPYGQGEMQQSCSTHIVNVAGAVATTEHQRHVMTQKAMSGQQQDCSPLYIRGHASSIYSLQRSRLHDGTCKGCTVVVFQALHYNQQAFACR
jgi:hypothetical protein